jgi:hypothetical protein
VRPATLAHKTKKGENSMYEKTGRTEYSPARALKTRVDGVDDVRAMVSGSLNIYTDTMIQAQVLINEWPNIAEAVNQKVEEIFAQIAVDPGE